MWDTVTHPTLDIPYINGMLPSGNLLPFAMDETTINKQWGYNWIMMVDWSLVGPDAF